MNDYAPLLDLVRQRPLDLAPVGKLRNDPECPSCGAIDLESCGVSSTCLGYCGEEWEDCNHFWEGMACKACLLEFTYEYKNGNGWYTVGHRRGGVVLKGMPSCFEVYVYDCARCDGKVRRRHTAMDGVSETSVLTYSQSGPCFRTFFECDKCGGRIETKYDHWDHPRRPPSERARREGEMWAKAIRGEIPIVEKIGPCIINVEAIARVKFDDEDKA